jgi:5-methylcytosine-specific restriction endonuclease McrA
VDEARYIDRALGDLSGGWEAIFLAELAALAVPDGLLGRKKSLLRADIGELWAKWFVESLADPRRYITAEVTYPKLFADVLRAVNERFQTHTPTEKQALASSASGLLQRIIESMATASRRRAISRESKSFLIEVAGSQPRCWICGSHFDSIAIDNFVYADRKPLQMPLFVDVLRPRGLSKQDLAIQVDHLIPVALGGGDDDNLALACGWCNRHKSARRSIYDVEGRPKRAGSNVLGLTSLPQPFWTVRHIATTRRCEHPEGCDRTTDNASLTVAPVNVLGALNPMNIRVTCSEHDSMRSIRLQPSPIVREVWSGEQ